MADEPQEPQGSEPSATDDPSTEPDETQLGDAGKKALDEERKARRDAEARLKELEPLAKRAKELEDAQKSDTEKLNEKLTLAEGKGREAETNLLRLEVALDQAPEGMSLAQLRKLAGRIQGSTREEMEADAAELFEDFSGPKKPADSKPKEKLKSGTDPEDDSVDGAALAQKILDSDRII